LDIAIDGALFANFFHQGQACESGTRVMVHEDIYDEFVNRLVAKAAALKVGDAMDHTSQVGPVISQKQYDNILASIKKAEADGGKIRCGGGRASGVGPRGFYVAPTVITGVSDSAECTQEEIFGPVCVVQKWADDDEVITRANNTRYGLAGGVWSKNIARAIAMAKKLRTGTVWINDWHIISAGAPFGGYGQSGIGRELGRYGLLDYTEIKHIHVDQGTPREERFFYDVLLGEDQE
jgi:aldehyde dehydrogenase (NAD+)